MTELSLVRVELESERHHSSLKQEPKLQVGSLDLTLAFQEGGSIVTKMAGRCEDVSLVRG